MTNLTYIFDKASPVDRRRAPLAQGINMRRRPVSLIGGKSVPRINTVIFLLFFLVFLIILFASDGYTVLQSSPLGTEVEVTPHKYWQNLITSPSNLILMLVGVTCVLLGILGTLLQKNFNQGIWYAGIGTVFTVVALFWLAGFGNTAFLPSLTSPESSLTIRNASSSEFTLRCMAYVTVLIPFVVGYIWYVWRMIDKKKITESGLSSH